MRVIRVDSSAPDREALREAAECLRAGGLVAFPTETVYGVGAHALDEAAVKRIYDAKGRPPLNPLIVHVATEPEARGLALEWTGLAAALAQAFWPGPITLVVRKNHLVPDIVTAGRDSVGVRIPSHPVALALLETAALPLAAPSANLSTQVSPTTAAHVERGLGDRVDLIIDGGPTSVGIESTVVDVTGDTARVLRPGMISREAIANVVGTAELAARHVYGESPLSPGMLGRHYAPKARVRPFHSKSRGEAAADARQTVERGERVGVLTFAPWSIAGVMQHVMPRDAAAYARTLYATLHALDDAGCAAVYVELPPNTPEWAAILDRLERATK